MRTKINELLIQEKSLGVRSSDPFDKFMKRVHSKHREELISKLKKIKSENKTVFGYGASYQRKRDIAVLRVFG